MMLEGIIGVLILIVLLMTWVWYINPKMKQTKDSVGEEIKESHFSLEEKETLLKNLNMLKIKHENLEKEFKKEKELCQKFENSLTQKSSEIIHISHQMRTSLSGLLGFTHFLNDSKLDEEQQEFVSIIETSSNELLTLVNGIIDMTPKPSDIKAKVKKQAEKDAQLIVAPKNEIPRLLVVDDNDINKRLLAKVLEQENLDVSYASNGQEAVDLRKSENFDIIFMDIQMPVMDGVEASQEIRKYENTESLVPVPIVALTANTGKDDRESYLAAGMNDYMAKPIMIDDVRQRISALQ